MDFAALLFCLLKDKYPTIYRQVELRLEAALEQFFQRDILIRHQISYQQALDEVVAILVDGIRAQ